MSGESKSLNVATRRPLCVRMSDGTVCLQSAVRMHVDACVRLCVYSVVMHVCLERYLPDKWRGVHVMRVVDNGQHGEHDQGGHASSHIHALQQVETISGDGAVGRRRRVMVVMVVVVVRVVAAAAVVAERLRVRVRVLLLLLLLLLLPVVVVVRVVVVMVRCCRIAAGSRFVEAAITCSARGADAESRMR